MNEQVPSYHPETGLAAHRLTTWQDLQDLCKGLRGYVDVKLGELERRLNQRMDAIEARMDRLEARMDAIEERMAVLEEKIDTVLTLLTQ